MSPPPMPWPSSLWSAVSFPYPWRSCVAGGVPFNLIGLISGGVAISQINGNPEEQTGKGLAIGGILASLASVVVAVIFFIFFTGLAAVSGLLQGM